MLEMFFHKSLEFFVKIYSFANFKNLQMFLVVISRTFILNFQLNFLKG